MLRPNPTERLSIGQIITENIPRHVLEYIESELFKAEWKLSRQKMVIMNEEDGKDQFTLHSVKMDAS